MTDSPSGLLREVADHVDELEVWPLGVATVVIYPDGTADIGYQADDLLALIGAVEVLAEELAELVRARAS